MADEEQLLAADIDTVDSQVKTPTGLRIASWAKVSLIGVLVVVILGSCLYHSRSVSPSLPNNFSKLYGVRVTDDVVHTFADIAKEQAHSYAVLKISDDHVDVVPKSIGSKAQPWKDLVDELPADEPRYALVDLNPQLVLVNWSPPQAPARAKMTYSTTKEALKHKLGAALRFAITVHDKEDLIQRLEDIAKR